MNEPSSLHLASSSQTLLLSKNTIELLKQPSLEKLGTTVKKNFQVVKEEVELWCQNMHPVVIGVKITDNTAVSTVQDPQMEVTVKVLGREDQEFHVGQGVHMSVQKEQMSFKFLLSCSCLGLSGFREWSDILSS